MNGIIGGTSLLESSLFDSFTPISVNTPYRSVEARRGGDWVFLQRHGDPPLPPHRIDHRANMAALRVLGVSLIISINSVGSLDRTIEPGTFLVPDDFLSPWRIPTFFDDEMRFTVPHMDRHLGDRFSDLCRSAGVPVKRGGTYVETLGPRLETRAEIGMLKQFGHVVGMTMASEATLALEAAIPYASLCSIDNYCNGVVETALTMEEIRENVSRNREAIEKVMEALITRGIT